MPTTPPHHATQVMTTGKKYLNQFLIQSEFGLMINVILSDGLISHLGFSLGLNLGTVVVCLNQLIISAGRLSVGFGGARRTTQRSGTSLIIINAARAGYSWSQGSHSHTFMPQSPFIPKTFNMLDT